MGKDAQTREELPGSDRLKYITLRSWSGSCNICTSRGTASALGQSTCSWPGPIAAAMLASAPMNIWCPDIVTLHRCNSPDQNNNFNPSTIIYMHFQSMLAMLHWCALRRGLMKGQAHRTDAIAEMGILRTRSNLIYCPADPMHRCARPPPTANSNQPPLFARPVPKASCSLQHSSDRSCALQLQILRCSLNSLWGEEGSSGLGPARSTPETSLPTCDRPPPPPPSPFTRRRP